MSELIGVEMRSLARRWRGMLRGEVLHRESMVELHGASVIAHRRQSRFMLGGAAVVFVAHVAAMLINPINWTDIALAVSMTIWLMLGWVDERRRLKSSEREVARHRRALRETNDTVAELEGLS